MPQHQDEIGLGMVKIGMREAVDQLTIIGSEDQALAIQVQPSGGFEGHWDAQAR